MLTQQQINYLNSNTNPEISLAENFIENAIGYYGMPLGVAAHFLIDEKYYPIPMAVEETSIIAAASKTAKWIQQHGYIETKTLSNSLIGQIQIAKVKDFSKLEKVIAKDKALLINLANEQVAQGLVNRGGGVIDLELRKLDRPDGLTMAVIHVLVDVCDAMGANIVDQICEYLKTPIEARTGETITMCILSNLSDTKLTQAKVVLENIDTELAEKIHEASIFAEIDPYRATTHNKGILNGIDPVLVATGNDWRAVEAGIHAYSARDGQYRAINTWRYDGQRLVGKLTAPICVGIVGGVTLLHPIAKISLSMLNVSSAAELARVIAAVGLVQNLGAIRALTTFKFMTGHMKLHLTNLCLSAGANKHEIPLLQKRLQEILTNEKRISLTHANRELNQIRATQTAEIVKLKG
ncbi:MAG: hydroxymethylglutaryl-CoA reductase, degradative [Pseudomonadota bacterium]